MLLKECKYIEKKVIRHINDNLSDFSSSSSSSSSSSDDDDDDDDDDGDDDESGEE